MKGVCGYLAAALLLAAPAAAQTTPGSLGGGQVGSGAVELPNLPQSGAVLAPATPTATSTAGTGATTRTTGGSGSSGGGGSGSGGASMPCLSANGTVSNAIADEFALSCRQ